jgi:DNA-binding transcriptional ArsR family regulator
VAPHFRLRIEVEAAAAYEFVLALGVLVTEGRDPYGVGAGWFARVREVAGDDFIRAAQQLSGGSDMVFAHLLSVAFDAPPPREPDGLIRALRAIPGRELRLRLLGYYVRYFRRATDPEVIARAAAGDAAAAAAMLRTSHPEDPAWQAALEALLPLDAEGTRRRFVRLLEAWRQPFEIISGDARRRLAAEAELRRAQSRTLSAERLIATVTGGWDYVPEPGIAAVLLVPSLVIRPTLHFFDHGATKIVCYPIEPEAGAQEGGADDRLVAVARALGDATRVAIMRRLAARPASATELALDLGTRLTTLAHHLLILERAGVISGSGPPRRRRYSLRPETLTATLAALQQIAGSYGVQPVRSHST